MEQKEFRVLIKHCFLMGKNATRTQEWLEKCYVACAPSKTTICRWFRELKCDRTSTDNAPRPRRPNEAVTSENAKKINQIVLNDRKVKVRQIADIVKISTERVRHILHEFLNMKKLCARWVPRTLTIDQKQQRVENSEHCLALFRRNPKEFLHRFVTIDETWIHHYTPESNRQSAEWLESHESRPKRPKTQASDGKVLASIFWDAQGIIMIDYLEKGQTITGDYYVGLLNRLNSEIKKKRPHLAKKKVLFKKSFIKNHQLTGP